MNITEFDYYLPENLIAQTPNELRDKCKLLIYDKTNNQIIHCIFKDIINYLTEADVLVLNNSKVMPARLLFNNGNNKLEILLIRKISGGVYDCMVRPGRKFKNNTELKINQNLKCKIKDYSEIGRIIEFYNDSGKLVDDNVIFSYGDIPLPPYITDYKGDKTYYQTVYSKINGSTAAPTAGLHFTEGLLQKIKSKICDIIEITLHIGPGTFQPLKCENIFEHKMHSEYYSINQEDYCKICNYKKNGKKIIAVGTTVVRTLETVFAAAQDLQAPKLSGETKLYISPGFVFRCVDSIITNFHLPRSSLIIMISAFISRKKVMDLYNIAVKNNYRFFSFGDAMFIR